jgi:hypothetical protein
MRKPAHIPALLLAVAISAPLIGTACGERHYYRVDDPYYHDSHRWDRRETVYYNQWVVETHRDPHHDFRSLNDRERKEYWEWRHKHDHDRDRDHDHDRH